MLAYVPGKLLLLFLKRSVSPLEDLTLACVLGLIVSGLAYWLIGFAHQTRFFLAWPLTAAAIFAWLHSIKRRAILRDSPKLEPPDEESAKRSSDKSGLALIGVVALGMMVLALLPLYYTNLTWRADGTMRVYPEPDVLLHIAIANELTIQYRPRRRSFPGSRSPITTGWIWSLRCSPMQPA